jgi:hypothetical protein
LTKAVSEASPITGADVYLNPGFLTSSYETSNLAYEQIIAVWCRILKEGSSISYSYSKVGPFSYLFWPLLTSPSYHKFYTVILFWVKVPVLSEQMQEVEPRVSTAYKFLTSTCLSASFLAVIAREIVMQASKP